MSQMTPFPPEGVAQGATNTARGYAGPVPSGNDGSGDLRAEAVGDCRSEEGITVGLIDGIIAIGRVLARRDFEPAQVREALADLRADEDAATIFAPTSLVVDDDTTVERVGQVIMHALARVAGEDYDSPKAAWSEVARAAVRALREAGSDA